MIETFVAVRCLKCQAVAGLSTFHYKACRSEHRTFWCAVCGQAQFFPGESDEEKLRKTLAATQQREEYWKREAQNQVRSKQTLRGHLTRIKKRAAHGVCPCCKRTFTQVQRHIAAKHPGFVEDNS